MWYLENLYPRAMRVATFVCLQPGATAELPERLSWKSWDVRELCGRWVAREIVDRHSSSWKHLNADIIPLPDAEACEPTESALWANHYPFVARVCAGGVTTGHPRRFVSTWKKQLRNH